MKRLSSVDAAFWFAQTHKCPTHGAGLMICDPAEAPNFCFDAVRDLLAARARQLPPLRYRVTGAPLGLDRPWFVEDRRFDIDFHVRRVAVPTPGGRFELEELVGRLMSYPLDRTRPLWELWFIEGLEHARVGILTKVHHALVDGVSGTGLFEAMFETCRQPPASDAEVGPAQVEAGIPRFGYRAITAMFNVAVVTPYRVARVAQQTMSQLVALRGLANRPPRLFGAPITRFNAEISPQRRVSSTRVSLDRVQSVKRRFGVKLNDVILALISGAMRTYLHDRGELPERSLVAQIPISTRGETAESGNQVTSTTVGLATDIAGPAERIERIHVNAEGAKETARVMIAHQKTGLTEIVPPGLVGLAARAYTASHLGAHIAPFNVVISNIDGPRLPVYVADSVVEQQVPIGALMMDIGLTITCFTYHGWAEFGFVTTREIANDIDEMAGAVEPALQELEEAGRVFASTDLGDRSPRSDSLSAGPTP